MYSGGTCIDGFLGVITEIVNFNPTIIPAQLETPPDGCSGKSSMNSSGKNSIIGAT